MNSIYSILFRVNFRHSYFADEIPDCFTVRPTADTERFLMNHAMLFKPMHDGFIIAYESSNNGNQNTAGSVLSSDHALTFTVSLKDALFFNYTDVAATDIGTSLFFFSYQSRKFVIAFYRSCRIS